MNAGSGASIRPAEQMTGSGHVVSKENPRDNSDHAFTGFFHGRQFSKFAFCSPSTDSRLIKMVCTLTYNQVYDWDIFNAGIGRAYGDPRFTIFRDPLPILAK